MSTIKVNTHQNLNGQSIFNSSSGTMVMTAGSTDRAPMRFTAGPGLTSPVAGSLEYNGNTFLTTSSSVSGKAFNDDSLFYGLDNDRTIVATVVANTFYDIFGVGISMPASSSYLFDIFVGLRTGATSHTVSFAFGGTAGIDKIQYFTDFSNSLFSTGVAAPAAPASSTNVTFTGNPNSAANGVISPASTTVTKSFRISGLIETSTAGTLRPQIAFSANPTGTNQVTRLSYTRFNSLGSYAGDLISGNWA
jgi:hypothetical protein